VRTRQHGSHTSTFSSWRRAHAVRPSHTPGPLLSARLIRVRTGATSRMYYGTAAAGARCAPYTPRINDMPGTALLPDQFPPVQCVDHLTEIESGMPLAWEQSMCPVEPADKSPL
jgi:hypothetical protein